MPTKEELQAEAAATGVPYNNLLAQHYKAGTLDVGLGEAQPVTEAPADVLVMEPGPTEKELTERWIKKRAPVLGRGGLGLPGMEPGREEPEMVSALGYAAEEGEKLIPAYQSGGGGEEEGIPGEPGGRFQLPKVPGLGLGKLQTKIDEAVAEYKKVEGGLGEAAEGQQDAIEKWKRTEMEAEKAKSDVLINQQVEWEKTQADTEKRELKRQEYVETEMNKVRDAVEQMKASKIDPYRFYKHPDGNTDYPKSIAAVIAVGLGALGSSLPASMGGTGGPNMALSILDRSIDRDISAQRDDIANQRAGVGIQMNLLSQMRGQFSDERQAENAARLVMLETFNMKLKQTAALSGQKRVIAKAEMMSADVAQKMAQVAGDMRIRARNAAVSGEEKMVGGRAKRAALQAQQQAAMQKAMATKGGKQLPASAVTKMADFRAAGGILGKVKETWNTEMKGTLAGGAAKYMPWATEAKKYNDKVRAAAQFVGKKLEGRMTDEDYDRILAMFPSPGDSDERAQAKFKALEDYLGAMESSTVETYGQTGFDVSGFTGSQTQGKPTPGFRTK